MTLVAARAGTEPGPRSPAGHSVPARPAAPRWFTATAVVAAGYVLLYLVLAVIRLRSPYELEWIEGGMVEHVAQIRSGHGLYGPPSLAFTPNIYTPLYFYVCAAVSYVTGVGFVALRVVSIVSSIALFGVVAMLTHVETRDRRSGIVAAGLFAATYRLSGAWLDIGRVDTLCIALLFGGLLVARRAVTTRAAILAGTLLSLAFLAKQVALLPAVAVVPFFLVVRRAKRLVAAYAATVAVGIGGTTLALQWWSHGWYATYVFTIPAHHAVAGEVYTTFFTHDLLAPLGIVLVLALVGLGAMRGTEGLAFHAITGSAVALGAFSARLHTGGYDNVLLPLYAELAVVGAIGLHRASTMSHRRWVTVAASAAALLQFGRLAYDPLAQLPSAGDRRAGDEMMAALRALPAPAYLPAHPWYLEQAGQLGSGHSSALEDVRRAHVDGLDAAVAHELWTAVAERRFAAIVVDSGAGYSYLPDNLCRYYRLDRPLVPSGAVWLPVTGTMTGPATVWVPRAAPVDDDCHGVGYWTIGPNG